MLLDRLCEWVNASVGAWRWEMCVYPSWGTYDRHISGRIARGGTWEAPLVGAMLDALQSHAAHRAVFVDVGANIGFWTLAAAQAGHEVYAFEPVPRNVAMVQASLARNKLQERVHLFAYAVGDRPTTFGMGLNGRNQGGVHHLPEQPAGRGGGGGGGTTLAVLPLRDTLGRIARERPTYVKLDVEAGECAAVRGMGDWPRTARIVGLQIEMQPPTKLCCERERWTEAGGLFHTLRTVHGLVPNVANGSACRDAPFDTVWRAF